MRPESHVWSFESNQPRAGRDPLLAARPTEDFSLAEISRQLEMSKASAHRLLVTTADADFLARNAKHKTY